MADLTSIPSSIIAGDKYSLLLTYTDYPAGAGYTGSLYLRGPSTLNVTGSANGNDHAFTITSANSALLKDGVYEYAVTVTLSGDRTTVENGVISVKPNLATSGTRISHISKMLSAVEAVLEGRVTDDVSSLSIAGRSITNIPVTELLELRAQYTKELAVLKGGPAAARKSVPIVFRRPS